MAKASTTTPSICSGVSINLFADNAVSASYSWTGPGFNSSSQNPTINNATVAYSGKYILTVSVPGCGNYFDSVYVDVKPKAFLTVNRSICQGQTYLGYSSTGTYVNTFVAANGCDSVRTLNLTVKSANSTISQSICQGQSYLGYTSTGTYIDTFIASDGCDSIRTLKLTVVPKMTSGLVISICEGENFLGHVQSGTYLDTLVNYLGCDSIIVTKLTVLKNCELYFPTAFTPNHDGKNDVFRILNAHNLTNYSLSVYNRWGQKIFETKEPTLGWDGIYNGILQPTGTYVWYSTFKVSGKNRKVKGAVTLLR